ncbi:MAG TPA: hypothetical protein VMS76_09630, partial [Planctomycetota bacterium]|nr:hypothetical protein [Planctomycetota bacterium]
MSIPNSSTLRVTPLGSGLQAFCFAIGALALPAIAPAQCLTERISVTPGGSVPNGDSLRPTVSTDGRYVAFESNAPDIAPGYAGWNVFVRDRAASVNVVVSVDSGGAQANGDSKVGAISADGRFVAFQSAASDLVGGDTNGVVDIFVRDLQAGTTTRVSLDSSGVEGNGDSFIPAITPDGRFIVFLSLADNLVAGDANGKSDVFVHDRLSGSTVVASVTPAGAVGNGNCGGIIYLHQGPSISADGRFVAFQSLASDLVAGDTNGTFDVFVRDLVSGTTRLASVSSLGIQGNSASEDPAISADGRVVAFESFSWNLVPGDTNASYDVFAHDLQTGETTRLSLSSAGTQANEESGRPTISADGRFVAFDSRASNLIPDDWNGKDDVFVHDRASGATALASLSTSGLHGEKASWFPSISAGGRFVVFNSSARYLVIPDPMDWQDAFLRDLGPSTLTTYCTAKVNSQGCLPAVSFSGTPSASAPVGFDVTAANVINDKYGLLFYGLDSATSPFQGGVLCVQAPIHRTAVQHSAGMPPPDDCSGRFAFDFNAYVQ